MQFIINNVLFVNKELTLNYKMSFRGNPCKLIDYVHFNSDSKSICTRNHVANSTKALSGNKRKGSLFVKSAKGP